MIKALLVVPFLALPLAFPLTLQDEAEDDTKAVTRAVQDYVEAFYQARPELIERSVAAELTKFGYWRNESGEYAGMGMTYEEAMSLADRWNKDGRQGDDLTFEIEIFDVADQTAAAKLTAKWGIDYMHLSKVDGKWRIRHVMWQSHPPTQD